MSTPLREKCFARDRGFCRICHRDLAETGERWEAHHRIPRSKGGKHLLANLITVCVPCHRRETFKQTSDRLLARLCRRWDLPMPSSRFEF